jgi:hypothetical protein
MACRSSVENILSVISECLLQYAESPQILETASDRIRSLVDAMLEIESSSSYSGRGTVDFAQELMHSIDWKERKSVHTRYAAHRG